MSMLVEPRLSVETMDRSHKSSTPILGLGMSGERLDEMGLSNA